MKYFKSHSPRMGHGTHSVVSHHWHFLLIDGIESYHNILQFKRVSIVLWAVVSECVQNKVLSDRFKGPCLSMVNRFLPCDEAGVEEGGSEGALVTEQPGRESTGHDGRLPGWPLNLLFPSSLRGFPGQLSQDTPLQVPQLLPTWALLWHLG